MLNPISFANIQLHMLSIAHMHISSTIFIMYYYVFTILNIYIARPPLRIEIPRQRFYITIQHTYSLHTHRDQISPPPSPKPSDMPLRPLPISNQPPGIEDEPIDVDAIDPGLNTDLEKMTHTNKAYLVNFMKGPERNIYSNLLNCKFK